MPCVLSTDFHTISLGDVNWTVTVIHQCRLDDYHQCWWRHRILLRQCTIMDANHCGRWTQRFQTAKL